MFGFFFFNDTATTEIYTLSLHDALPICEGRDLGLDGGDLLADDPPGAARLDRGLEFAGDRQRLDRERSEEHTSELQSQSNLVCRLLLEKKKKSQVGHTARDVVQRQVTHR